MLINMAMIKKLVVKDWDLNRKFIVAYLLGGVLGLVILATPDPVAFYMGSIILLTIIIGGGFHLLMSTTIMEKKEQNLPFIMSLPVKPVEYGLAKIMSNLGIILALWAEMTIGFSAIIYFTGIPDGILVLFWLVSLHVVVNYTIVLSVSIIFVSEGWTIFFMVVLNLLLNPLIAYIGQSPEMNQYFSGDRIVFTDKGFTILVVQIMLILIFIGITLWQQSRRRTFI